MKKTVLFAALLLAAGVQGVSAASLAQCLLHHEGKVTMYDAGSIETALKDAVAGDTLFLTEGTFSGFTIEKAITVRGAGDSKTILSSGVDVKMSNSPSLTQPLLEGLYVNGGLTVSSSLSNMKIKQCYFTGDVSFSANISDAMFDKCYITGSFFADKFAKSLTVANSYISRLQQNNYDSSNAISFVNCEIYCIGPYSSDVSVTLCNLSFINSILYYTYYYRNSYGVHTFSISLGYCTFVNCEIGNNEANGSTIGVNRTIMSTCVKQDCYITTSLVTSKQDLEDNKYFGTDGTVVGYNGGTTPYTLTLSVPNVTEKTLTYDAESKALNVTLKVSAQ